jgi:hypothetical protein
MSKSLQCNLSPVINWRLVTQLSVNHLWLTFIKHFPHLTAHSECSCKLVCPTLEANTNCLRSITYCDVLACNTIVLTLYFYICWHLPWRWRQCIPHKYWYLSTWLYCITSQVIVTLRQRTCCAMMKPQLILCYQPNIFLVMHKNTNFFYNAQFLIKIHGRHPSKLNWDELPLQ